MRNSSEKLDFDLTILENISSVFTPLDYSICYFQRKAFIMLSLENCIKF